MALPDYTTQDASTYKANIDSSISDLYSGPAFSAYTSSTYTHNANDVCRYQTETFDTESNYDNTTYKFTPLTAGYYYISSSFTVDLSSGAYALRIRKNASTAQNLTINHLTGNVNTWALSVILYMNGSTDYIDCIFTGAPTTMTTGIGFNTFEAFKIPGI